MQDKHDIKPFGSHPLTAWESTVIGLTRAMPQGWAGKRLALLLRKLVKGAMNRPVDIEVFGRKMRLDGTRNIAERRLLIQPQHFDPLERQVLSAHLRPGGVAVDIGANVGAYTVFMAGLVGREGRVLAVEPQPSVLARLRENLALNPELTVTVAAVALGDKQGEATFEPGSKNEGEGKLAQGHSAGGFKVPVDTLHNLASAHGFDRIDALKIDVEGWEPHVLLPFFETAPRALWPRLIVIERVNDRWTVDLIGRLKQLGYADKAGTRLNAVLGLA
jgi:FkbM family methyltransferase